VAAVHEPPQRSRRPAAKGRLRRPLRPEALSRSDTMIDARRTQVIRIGAADTHFEGWCERCLDEPTPQSLGVRWLVVDGELPLAADAGLTSCRRGHRIAVRRLGRLTDAA